MFARKTRDIINFTNIIRITIEPDPIVIRDKLDRY